MSAEQFFNDILAGKNPHRKAEEAKPPEPPVGHPLEALFKATKPPEKTPLEGFFMVMMENKSSAMDAAIGPRCMSVIDDLRFGEKAAKTYSDYVKSLLEQSTPTLYIILRRWRDSMQCECGKGEHITDSIIIHALMPIVKDEILRRIAASKK